MIKTCMRYLVKKIIILLLMAGIVAACALPGAQRETQRREAYLPQLEDAARHDPYDGRLLALLGGRQMEAGEYQSAADTLEKAVAAGEKTDLVWLTLASATAATGDPRALGFLRVGEQETKSPAIQGALERCQALEKTRTPITLASAICPQGPEPLVTAYTQGSFLNGLREWWGRLHPDKSGFATRQDWVRRQPNNAQAQRLWGLALIQNRRIEEASAALQQAVALAPNSAAAHLAMADLLAGQSLFAQASLEYIAALKLHPDWLPALLGLGRTTLVQQLPLSAIDIFTEAVKIAPQSAEAWIGLGQADVLAQKNYDAAQQAFQTAVRLAPRRTDFFMDYAIVLRQNGRLKDAEAMLRRSLAADPENARIHYLLADLLVDFHPTPDRLAEAQTHTQEALRLAPDAPPAQQQMAMLLLRQGKPQAAISLLQKVLAEDPGNVGATLLLSHAYQQAGLTTQAAQSARQVAALSRDSQRIDVLIAHAFTNPGDIGVHGELAKLYAQIGQRDKARQEQEVTVYLRSGASRKRPKAQTLASLIAAVVPGQ